MRERPRGTELVSAGDLNADLERTGGRGRDKDITAVVATVGLEDLSEHFLPQWCPWCRGKRAWAVVQLGREVRSRTDYILGSDRQIIQNVAVRDPRHNSNHFMVMVCLCGASPREHSRYLG